VGRVWHAATRLIGCDLCPADHPLIEDLKRTDFAVLRELDESDVYGPQFAELVAETFAAGSPFMRFLCTALGLPY